MPTLLLPYQRDPIAGGFTTPNNWYEFFRAVKQTLNESGLDPGVISDIQARLAALEAESSGFTMQGLSSVSVFGTPEGGLVRVELNNDDVAPGNTYYYGTDSAGVKGWHTVRSALDFGDGIDLTTGSDGVTEISFNAATAEVASLPGATYKTVQKAIDVLFSPGIITGGEITELTTTSVRITGGTAIVRIADDNVSELRFFDFASQDFTLPDDQVTRFYALSYNGGSPLFVESVSSENWDRDTELPVGSAFRAGPVLNITPNLYKVGDIITNFLQRLDAIGPVQRDNSVGGLQLGETGTRNVTLTGGKLWSRISDFTIAAKNSATDTMVTSYYNGTNTTVTAGVTQWDNLQFNNTATGTLQTLGNNKYANLWFFMSFNGDHYGFAYGTNEYNTIGDAANEGVPSHFSQNFFNQFILLGRFIFQKSASTAALIESAFATPLTTQAINTHNNLGGLQGGTTGEFYHLTSAEYTKIQALPSASQPLDATLTALAGQNWAANALPIGSGADTVSQVSFAANTFPARSSTGNLIAKAITDDALALMADADVPRLGTANTWSQTQTINAGLVVDTDTLVVDSVNNRVGIGQSAPTFMLEITGATAGLAATRTGGGEAFIQLTDSLSSANGGQVRGVVSSPGLRFTDRSSSTEWGRWDGADFKINGGRLYGTALHNNASALTGATNQYVGSGTYTPTLTGITNIDSVTLVGSAQWMRVGNVVTVSLAASIDVTTANIASQISITLPIASATTGFNQIVGTGASGSQALLGGAVTGDAASDTARLNWFAGAGTSAINWSIHFTYLVI